MLSGDTDLSIKTNSANVSNEMLQSSGIVNELSSNRTKLQSFVESINDLEQDMSHSVSFYAEQLKRNIKLEDLMPLEEHEHLIDFVKEKISTIVSELLARILVIISESISRLRSNASDYDPNVGHILLQTKKDPGHETDNNDIQEEGKLKNNDVVCERDAMAGSFGVELTDDEKSDSNTTEMDIQQVEKAPMSDRECKESLIPKTRFKINGTGDTKESECTICQKWLAGHAYNYYKHMRRLHSKVYESYQCFDCEMSFRFNKDLIKHCKEVHASLKEKEIDAQRLKLTSSQRNFLLDKFAINDKPLFEDMEDIASAIGLDLTKVQTWFHTSRLKMSSQGYIYKRFSNKDKDVPATPRTCPVCKASSTDLSSDAMMKFHLSEHLFFDIGKEKILTHDGQDWELLKASLSTAARVGSKVLDGDQSIKEEFTHVTQLITFDDFQYSCLMCNVKFINSKELKSHRFKEHKDIRVVQYVGSRKESIQLPKYQDRPQRTKRKTCDVCGANVLAQVFRDHMRVHENANHYKCDICHIQLSSLKGFRKHKLIHTRKEGDQSFMCDVCGKGFWHKHHLKVHMKVHFGQRANFKCKCGICQKEFTSESAYSKHRKEHKPDLSIVCDICGKSFSRPQYLKIHQIKTHFKNCDEMECDYIGDGDGEIYSCQYCQKVFKQKITLKEHEKIHLEGKPTCSLCHKTFSFKHVLQAHIKSVHTNERPFRCEICLKTFTTKHLLELHKAVHTDYRPFKCDICQMTFKQKNVLRAHKTTHTGIKPHECDICHRKFRLGHILRAHYRIHTGEKPYHCQVCGQKFRQRGDLTQHMKKHASRGECTLVTTINSKNMNIQSPTDITFRNKLKVQSIMGL